VVTRKVMASKGLDTGGKVFSEGRSRLAYPFLEDAGFAREDRRDGKKGRRSFGGCHSAY